MPNFTIEDYKEAIRAKYEKDVNNPLSDDLRLLGQAYLRDLCWEKFEGGLSEDDLKVFASFFGFEFNSLKRNLFRDKTDKFRPIGTFLKRQTDLASREAVDLTAILVDFQHRPFRKFKEKGIINYLKHPEDSKISEPFAAEYKDEESNEGENVNDSKEASTFDFIDSEEVNVCSEIETETQEVKPLNLFVNTKENAPEKPIKKLWRTGLLVVILLCFGFAVSYYFFPKKQCMQWNNDHYDIVDCDLEVQGAVVFSKIERLDETKVNLKKIKVCDTTSFFKNGEAAVFYAKSNNTVEYFNQLSSHPEKPGQFLKPITNHIIDKYVEPCK
ncbi:hypothetical protein [uncultured Flavobacterium sp.]|uniref:hypothetical protein n=1 Tax=uncultured Flavobacterium sp. TaxID=165435 RepID=UPI002931E8F7|nr:hypothetical protein [uncultured Flavobacterium sp.]